MSDIILLREIVSSQTTHTQRSFWASNIPPDSLGQVLIIHENYDNPIWELTVPGNFHRLDNLQFPTHCYINGRIELREKKH